MIRTLLASVAIAFSSAYAHEINLADGRVVDYTGLKRPQSGRSCCGNQDCRVVESHWLPDNSLVVETAPGMWHTVPNEAIIWLPPEQLRETSDLTHACWLGTLEEPQFICVFPEATSS